MAITVNSGDKVRLDGVFQCATTMTASTATGLRAIDTVNDVVSLLGATATGFSLNRFSLPTTGVLEGQCITVVGCATQETYLVLAGGTATGARVFSATGQWETYRFLDRGWRVLWSSGPTIATATGTA